MMFFKINCYFCSGELAEWSIAAVLKTVVPRGTGGSNPSLSAGNLIPKVLAFVVFSFWTVRNLFRYGTREKKTEVFEENEGFNLVSQSSIGSAIPHSPQEIESRRF